MMGLFALAMLGMVAAMAFGAVMLVFAAGKLLLWFLFWPIRLAVRLVFLPFLLLRFMLRLALGLLLLPLALVGVFVGVGVAAFLGLFLVFLPMVPLLLLGLVIWGIVKASTRQTVPAVR